MTDAMTMTQVMSRTGWTRTRVRRLLGDPDQVRRRYGGGQIYLYAKDRVLATESTEDFRSGVDRSEARKAAGRVAAATREELVRREVEALAINIPVIPVCKLVDLAIDHYNYRSRGDLDACKASDPEFLSRITFNYVRHELTQYEYIIAAHLRRTPGINDMVEDLRGRVNDAIGEAYPGLDDYIYSLRP